MFAAITQREDSSLAIDFTDWPAQSHTCRPSPGSISDRSAHRAVSPRDEQLSRWEADLREREGLVAHDEAARARAVAAPVEGRYRTLRRCLARWEDWVVEALEQHVIEGSVVLVQAVARGHAARTLYFRQLEEEAGQLSTLLGRRLASRFRAQRTSLLIPTHALSLVGCAQGESGRL